GDDEGARLRALGIEPPALHAGEARGGDISTLARRDLVDAELVLVAGGADNRELRVFPWLRALVRHDELAAVRSHGRDERHKALILRIADGRGRQRTARAGRGRVVGGG